MPNTPLLLSHLTLNDKTKRDARFQAVYEAQNKRQDKTWSLHCEIKLFTKIPPHRLHCWSQQLERQKECS
jgi:hypothetical protein